MSDEMTRMVVSIEINNNDFIWMWHVIYMYTYTCTNGHLSQGRVLDNMMSYTCLYCSSLQFLLLFLFINICLLNCCLHNTGYMPATSYLDISTFVH